MFRAASATVATALSAALLLAGCADAEPTPPSQAPTQQLHSQESSAGQSRVPTVVVRITTAVAGDLVPAQFEVFIDATYVQGGVTGQGMVVISGVGTPAQINAEILAAARRFLEDAMGPLPPGTQYTLFGGAQ